MPEELEELSALVGVLGSGGPGPSSKWAAHCAALLEIDGISVSSRVPTTELLWFSGQLSAPLDDLQFTLGEGPSLEAARDGSLHLLTDLRRMDETRWPAFLPGALELGIRMVFALPLRLGAIRVGSLTGHRCEARPLSEVGLYTALTLCEALTHHLLSPRPASTGGVRAGSETYGTLHRAVVHQATGMASVDLGVDLATALDRLRAYAFAHNRPIVAVSQDVVAKKLRLNDDRQ
ncbi:ANTAR domain-containing protein [Streptomyces sp. NPDC004111]|uniref:ANTAR domain-containing protein n=1 Tax=Streptomyces sp. NPDC004111 TaxID=3364690 RepID=UPI0036CB158B